MVSKRLDGPDHTAPNNALQLTASSVRYAPRFRQQVSASVRFHRKKKVSMKLM